MRFYHIFLLFCCSALFAQDTIPNFSAIDSLYREDQFYTGISYNILQNRNDGIRQNKISYGITAGFLRDMPLNERRNFSIAAGLGYSFQNYNQNILVSKNEDIYSYSTLDPAAPFNKNKIQTPSRGVPIEFRWRTSNAESHKFWRVYTGFKVGYVFYDVSKYDGSQGTFVYNNNPDISKINYSVYTALGYNTWNATVAYGLNPIFENGNLNGNPIKLNTLSIGLLFYIL